MKKVVLLLVSMFVVISVFAAFAVTGVFAGSKPEVKLSYAKYTSYSGRYTVQRMEGQISLNNVSPKKKVVVHYSSNNIDWKDVDATYLKTNKDGKEIWSFSEYLSGYTQFTFAVKYEVNNQVVWDNNNGKNYTIDGTKLTSFRGVVVFGTEPIVLDSANYYSNLDGTICLKNIGYNKDVKIRYSTDNWATYKEANAQYGSNYTTEGEFWRFSIPGLETKVEFAVSYTVNGQTYWDNNQGANYTLEPYGYIY